MLQFDILCSSETADLSTLLLDTLMAVNAERLLPLSEEVNNFNVRYSQTPIDMETDCFIGNFGINSNASFLVLGHN